MGYEPVISCGRVGSVTVVRPQPRTQSLDLSNHAMQTTPLSLTNSHIAHSTPTDLSTSCASPAKTHSTQALESTLGEEENRDSSSANLVNGTDSLGGKESNSLEHISTVTDSVTKDLIKESEDCTVTATELSLPQQQGTSPEQSEQGSAPVSEGDSGIDPCAEGGEEDGAPGGTEGAAGGSMTNNTETNTSETSSKQQDKKKGEVFLQSLSFMFLFNLYPYTLGVLKVSF